MLKKVLVANRGEIALRIVRACHDAGIEVVVAHSSRDRDSEAVRLADRSVQVGPATSIKSYLNAAAVLEAATQSGADAVHPGYGFLSENADFAEACLAAGLTFVGPPPAALELLGSKTSARATMSEAGLPLLPGSREYLDPDSALDLAWSIGFPVIVKAAAGGGGLGMHVVHEPERFIDEYLSTSSTAGMLFGDRQVYVEKYLEPARHVEIQVLCDAYGNAVHLGTRDCTLQRRHQKLVEEAPAPRLPLELLEEMGEAACRGAVKAGFQGAGTFEFLVGDAGRFYFLEVNCRIQVEHPVTEMVTGIDLVQEQMRIAGGAPLSIRQCDVKLDGVAIECRINAEDPKRGFTPAPGTIQEWVPSAGPFVRVDSHVRPGYTVPPEYDSLLAKLIVWAPDRAGAIVRMKRALSEFHVAGPGIETTREFLMELIEHPYFHTADHSTSLVEALTS
ncbi:acetyl-CoA carboxylase biotin carboxylase subunit [Phytoactinopolyspora mesophila]|uniref:biotin carboxylase n=1 Tax=Phytoactinopolyspora mesophila TaxID=2650750 RepID=A0A7K3M0U7_9ACTN|nr:acetyl-CoA carboxylase biotin carboxylase subunit [Phytoactinopolyspora mesophila]NDL56899.1 acetyl-CoA carboxylase biotin carboxylase subunit [Phytoactinopolyspora mesophila]